jgi:hypothetical protein
MLALKELPAKSMVHVLHMNMLLLSSLSMSNFKTGVGHGTKYMLVVHKAKVIKFGK